jgi:MFS family permease
MSPRSTASEKKSLIVLLTINVANVFMSINQVNVASVYIFISSEFHQTVYGLGVLTAAFFLGYGLFEIPGGIAAAKLGPRRLVILGAALNSLAVIAFSIAPAFSLLPILRLIAGLGFAFAFPSMIVLIIRSSRGGGAGMGAAQIAVSMSIGLTISLFGWSVLGAVFGWRASILLAGLLTLAATAAMLRILPGDDLSPGFSLGMTHLRQVIFNRSLVLLGVAFFGAGATVALTSNFMVFYLEAHLLIDPASAGLVGASGAIPSMFTSVLVGRLYDRHRRWKIPYILSAASLTFATSLASLDFTYAALAANTLAGLAAGAVFTLGLSTARDFSIHSPEMESFSIGWVDSFSLLGNVASPIYFSFIVLESGYPLAWLIGGGAAIVFALPILFLKNR